jgi:hypothetical protein
LEEVTVIRNHTNARIVLEWVEVILRACRVWAWLDILGNFWLIHILLLEMRLDQLSLWNNLNWLLGWSELHSISLLRDLT